MITYPLGDVLSLKDQKALALGDGVVPRAIRTGVIRAPLMGEWYLSGAIPTAYRAYVDLVEPRQICRIVGARSVTRWEIVSVTKEER